MATHFALLVDLGSAALIIRKGSKAIIKNSTFMNNQATYGAVTVNQSSLHVEHSYFGSNIAVEAAAMNIQHNSNLDVRFCTFSLNRARDGSVVFAEYDSNVNMSASNFTSNRAEEAGSVYMEKNCSLGMYGCVFAMEQGNITSVIWARHSTKIRLENSQFIMNTVTDDKPYSKGTSVATPLIMIN